MGWQEEEIINPVESHPFINCWDRYYLNGKQVSRKYFEERIQWVGEPINSQG